MKSQTPDELVHRAATLHQSGQLRQAEELYASVLETDPANAVALHNLGVIDMQTGRGLEQALPKFKAAWRADPSHQQHWVSLLRALVQSGDTEEARRVQEEGSKRGLRGPDLDMLRPKLAAPQVAAAAPPSGPASLAADDVKAWRQQFDQLMAAGQKIAAEALARGLGQRHPSLAEAWSALASALRAQGRGSEALEALKKSAALAPKDFGIRFALASFLAELGLWSEAAIRYREALELAPGSVPAHKGLVEALLKTYGFDEAQRLCTAALSDHPGDIDWHLLLAEAQEGQLQLAAARQTLSAAWRLAPGAADVYQRLGRVLLALDDHEGMIALTREMLALKPGQSQAHTDLGRVLLAAGRLDEAALAFQSALERDPADLRARESWLFCVNYLDQMTPEQTLAEARAYGRELSRQAQPFSHWERAVSGSRLRIGLVSGDLREHPVAYFLEGLLAHLDPQRIEVHVYSTTSHTDTLTARLQSRVASWQLLVGLNTEQAAERIHRDGIHILVDLSGHSALNALPIFAWRPAPVQASWLGYFATTGVREIDYFIADRVSVPETARAAFTESIWYLPETRLCFTAPDDAPEVSALPALGKGYITFGCFQTLRKINADVLRAWSRILASSPAESRLRLQCPELGNAGARIRMGDQLERAGIDLKRVDLHGPEPRASYLASYSEVDLILDTFPFPGGTTTCEALWMGVPTITLSGERLIARQGEALLAAAKLEGWVARSEDAYVGLALQKAADPQGLAQLRKELRQHLRSTPLFDAAAFAEQMQTAFEGMWRKHRGGPPDRRPSKPSFRPGSARKRR